MQVISSQLKNALGSEISQFCYCWEIIRQDGSRLGLTDHNKDIVIDGVRYHANAGMKLSRIEKRSVFHEQGLDVEGVLNHPLLKAEDLEAGLYDTARFRVWLVNWQDPSNRLHMLSGSLGDVSHDGTIFRVAVKSHAAALNSEVGDIYQRQCPAQLGDARCHVDLTQSRYSYSCEVIGVMSETVTVDALDYGEGWFANGVLEWNGVSLAIRDDRRSGHNRHLILWDAAPKGLLSGDAVTIKAGCNHSPQMCKSKFSNFINFQGFPYMPERDILIHIDRNHGG